jgi:hypothetical protein
MEVRSEEDVAKRFVEAPGGGPDFGKIDDEAAAVINKPSGAIRLQEGYPGPKGYGNRHIEGYPDRIRRLSP